MELIGRKGQFNVLPMPLGSPSRSASSEDLLIWSAAEDGESDGSFIPAHLEHPTISHFHHSGISATGANSCCTLPEPALSLYPRHLLSRHAMDSLSNDSHLDHLHNGRLLSRAQSSGSLSTSSTSRTNRNRLSVYSPSSRARAVANVEDYIEVDLGPRSALLSDADDTRSSVQGESCAGSLFFRRSIHLVDGPILYSPEMRSESMGDSSTTYPIASFSNCCAITRSAQTEFQPLCATVFDLPSVHNPDTSTSSQILSAGHRISAATDFSFTRSASQAESVHLQPTSSISLPSPHVSSSSTSSVPNSIWSPGSVQHCDSCEPRGSHDLSTSLSVNALSSDASSVPQRQLTCAAVMLCQTNDLASGDTLTCTLVNILRGLHLLDRCGLEDLCASLCGLRTFEPSLLGQHTVSSVTTTNAVVYPTEPAVTRSSSFTSLSLVSPRRSSFSRDRPCVKGVSGKAETSVGSNQHRPDCCVVDFILSCSGRGSTLDLRHHASGSLHFTDWRHGCAANLVALLTSSLVGDSKNSRATIGRLLTGKFFPGAAGWRSVWPRVNFQPRPGVTNRTTVDNLEEELTHWLSAWISRGAVVLLAELAVRTDMDQSCSTMSALNSPLELVWRHRLVYGVTERNEVFLSNPEALVPVGYILRELSRQATLRLEKSELLRLWCEHQHRQDGDFLTMSFATECPVDAQHQPVCSGDFSKLACQSDTRWNEMNVLGQVLQTLRGLETHLRHSVVPTHSNSASNPVQLEHSCLSPTIHIPSSQSPGFSIFVARSDWELCHALHNSSHLSFD